MKARRDRTEAAVKRQVRAEVVARDGYCRLRPSVGLGLGDCSGPSEWAHLGEARRSRTRGQAPELRHSAAQSVMLCRLHHAAYDQHAIDICAVSLSGADGALSVKCDGRTVYSETLNPIQIELIRNLFEEVG